MRRFGALTIVVGLVAVACGGGDDGGAGNGAVDPSACPVDALDDADGPVTIRFWHIQTEENLDLLEDLVEDFESQQDAVRVELVQLPTYPDLLTRFTAGFTTGDLPDVAQFEETAVQTLLDTEATLPVAACVEADDFDTSDFLDRSLAYYTVQDTLHALAWPVSNPILFYDRNAFVAADLDPDQPPRTLDEVREYSEQIVASGAAPHGIALPAQPYLNEFFFAKAGQPYVDNGNGREGRATESLLDSEAGVEIWTWWHDMVESGLMVNTGTAPNSPDHLLAVGNGVAAMSMEASSVLGLVFAALASGLYPDVEIAGAPLPGLAEGGGVPVGDGSLWLSARSTPEQRAAAWEWVKFITSTEAQVTWTSFNGAVPTRESVASAPEVQALWEEQPVYRVAYDQLTEGELNDATVGSVIGSYQGVRDAVRDGLTSMLTGGATPEEALAEAERAATEAIEQYNASVGG